MAASDLARLNTAEAVFGHDSVPRRRLNNESETWRCREEAGRAAEGKDDLAWTRERALIRKANTAIRRHLNKRKKCDVKFNSQRAAAKQQSCEWPRREVEA